MAALSLENLTKRYGDKDVVQSISLKIEEGEVFGLLGPNGAGKSSTINMVSGVTRPTSGQISIFGHDNQKDFITARRLTGVMHQEIVMDNFFTIGTALKIHAGYYGVADDPKWRARLVDRLALGPHLEKQMNKLSGGMKRRFMVAKALIHKPRLLILDEPTAGVDVELRQTLWEFVRELNKELGTTVVLTTHYLEEAEEMCARVAIMNYGKIIALDQTKHLLDKMDERRLLVHLSEKIGALPAGLDASRVSLINDGASLSFKINADNSPASVLAAVTTHQLAVKDIETKSPSLQEAFLKLTSGSPNRA
ncbi:MAG: ABC transporter ATP-binding protein [Proteobacteria bacterium]|nr:MAG: ABC transporter ATP-binding protein [Pseudomonadota bacterium]